MIQTAMIPFVSVRSIIFSSLLSVAFAGLDNFHLVPTDDSWNEPIHVHVDKGVGCVNISGHPACEPEPWVFGEKDSWVTVPTTNCDNDSRACDLVVTIDFGFDPSDKDKNSYPNYSQEFKLNGINHDAWFRVSDNKYCLYAQVDPKKWCFDPNVIYNGASTQNPYVGYRGPKPTYRRLSPDDQAYLNPASSTNEIELASNAEGPFTNMNMETQSPSELNDGLTKSKTLGMSLTSNFNLNGIPSTDKVEVQTPNINSVAQVVSGDLGYLSTSNNNDLFLSGILGNAELEVPATSNSNASPLGTVPFPWKA